MRAVTIFMHTNHLLPRTRRLWRAFAVGGLGLVLPALLRGAGHVTLDFNPDWRFIKDDPAGAAAAAFDDSGWTAVSAPHTYNDVDTFDDWSILGHRGEQNQWSGRTWYRKSFVLPKEYAGKKVFLEFEAARQIAEVYLNGQLLGVSKTGFTPFGFDLTPLLRTDGTPNVLAVMCDNRFIRDTDTNQPVLGADINSASYKRNNHLPAAISDLQADQIPWNNPHWHPAHGGLYRNVRLHVTDPLHISLPLYSFLETEGPYVYATGISSSVATVNVEVPLQNERTTAAGVEVQLEVFDAAGRLVASDRQTGTMAPAGTAAFKLAGPVAAPRLWEPNDPYLYRVVCTLRSGGEVADTFEVPFGIRTARWEVREGFFINGRHVKLHGWGQRTTDEWPGLGAAQPDWMHFLTLRLMQEAGGNFVRWGHCPVGPSSIAAADILGVVTDQPGVDGESDTSDAAWALRAAAFRDVVIYFRNHPSILIWEGGNQKVVREHAAQLRGIVDQYDPYGGRAYGHRRADAVTAQYSTVYIGTEGDRDIATLPVVEGEYNREESPRRVWDNYSPPNFGYPEGKGQTYGENTSELYATSQVQHYLTKIGADSHSGGGNWIFSDTTSGGRVSVEVARGSGEVDGVRLPKEAYYVCRTLFRNDPQVHVIGHWTYPAGTTRPVYAVAKADEVELFVNGRSLGRAKPTNQVLFTFAGVAWEPGEIRAVAYRDGKAVASQAKHTVGEPVALKLTPLTGPGGLRADGSDVLLVDVEAVDANGERCPTVQQRVDFAVEGPGVWRGGYNSGKINSTNNAYLDLECGINRVAVRATRTAGAITVRAESAGLRAGSLTVSSRAVAVVGGGTTDRPLLTDPAPTEESRLVNVSIRTSAGTGAHTLIAGFTVAGTGKPLLIRGIGPALAPFGVRGTVTDPRLAVYAGQALLATNDNWGDANAALIQSTTAAAGAFALGTGGKDAAVATTLDAGAYTAHVTDAAGGSGVALAEIYDAGPKLAARVTGVSGRGDAGGGDGVLVAGFVIAGSAPKTVLVRGLGPALEPYGVTGALADPQLALYAGSRLVAANDDWGSAENAAQIASLGARAGAFPLGGGSHDAAVLLTLPPGAYTAHVSGVAGAGGVGLVEIYTVD